MSDIKTYLDEEGFVESGKEEVKRVLAQYPEINQEFERMRRGESTKDFYDFMSQMVGGISLYDFLKSRSRSLVEWRVREISKYVNGGGKIVDAGCGMGLEAVFFAQLAEEGGITGVDSSEAMLNLARKRAEKRGLENLRFLNADMESLPIEGSSQDLVYCIESLYDNRPKGEIFSRGNDEMGRLHEFRRVLRMGGKLIFTLTSKTEDSCNRAAECYEEILDCLDYGNFSRTKGYHTVADGASANHMLVIAEAVR